MKKIKKLVTIMVVAMLAVLPSMTATAQSQNEVQIDSTSYDGELGYADIGEPPLLSDTGDSVPPVPTVGGIEGYECNYLSIIDIATGQYFEHEVVLEPHKVYAVHAYMQNTYFPEKGMALCASYSYPTTLSTNDSTTIQLVFVSSDSGVPAHFDDVRITATENLQILPIIGQERINNQPIDPYAICTQDGVMIATFLQPKETKEIVFFFQTVGEGAEPIVIQDSAVLESIPILGDVTKIAGVPLLCPAEYAVNPDAHIGDSIVGLPTIAPRVNWEFEHPELHQKG